MTTWQQRVAQRVGKRLKSRRGDADPEGGQILEKLG